jgi:uncharacterized protein YndB with AHSA1/START domain
MDQVRVEEFIAAPPSAVYDMVSDVTRMGAWSPETTSCRWIGGATKAVVGARFRGANQNGWRRWRTGCIVISAEPGQRFAFDVHAGPVPVSQWVYEFSPASSSDGDGCLVAETWTDRRPGWMIKASPMMTGVSDRTAQNRENMRATLARLRAEAEADGKRPPGT